MDEPAVPGDADRIEALEQQIRQLTSRLAGWVEAQLVQAVDDRRNDMSALRSELHEASSVLSVATRRLEVAQEQLAERLDAIAARGQALGDGPSTDDERLDVVEQQVSQRLAVAQDLFRVEMAAAEDRHQAELEALRAEMAGLSGVPAAGEALEQRVRSAMSRLSDSVEARLVEISEQHRTELAALAGNPAATGVASATGAVPDVPARLVAMTTSLGQRLDEVAARVASAFDEVAALKAEGGEASARLEAFEQRVKAAMGRLSDSMESRLAAGGDASAVEALHSQLTRRLAEVEGQLATGRTVSAALQEAVRGADERTEALEQRMKSAVARLNESVDARADELEQRVKAAVGQLAESVEARLAEAAAFRPEDHVGRADLRALREQLENGLAAQLHEARTDIGTIVAEAHRRFVVSVDELHERMNVVADQAAAAHAAASGIETMQETVTSDGRRIEALEVHTRRTDARLGEVVEVKLAEMAAQRGSEVDGARDQMRVALDAHLARTRTEATRVLSEGRKELDDRAEQLDQRAAELEARQGTLDRQAAQAVAGLDALGESLEVALREAEARLAESVDAKLTALESVAAQLVAERPETAATMASLTRKVARLQDQVQKKLTSLVEQVDGLSKAASNEAGTLAPLRSDLRQLHTQVTELSETVAELRPRRKAPATPAKDPLTTRAAAARARAEKLPAKAVPARERPASKKASPAPDTPVKATRRRTAL